MGVSIELMAGVAPAIDLDSAKRVTSIGSIENLSFQSYAKGI